MVFDKSNGRGQRRRGIMLEISRLSGFGLERKVPVTSSA